MPNSSDSVQHIKLLADAPDKPDRGMACNGCGVCCAAEPCPLARLVLRQHDGACRALMWNDAKRRYFCGLVMSPSHYRAGLKPLGWLATAVFRRMIAAGKGCDSDAVVVEQHSD